MFAGTGLLVLILSLFVPWDSVGIPPYYYIAATFSSLVEFLKIWMDPLYDINIRVASTFSLIAILLYMSSITLTAASMFNLKYTLAAAASGILAVLPRFLIYQIPLPNSVFYHMLYGVYVPAIAGSHLLAAYILGRKPLKMSSLDRKVILFTVGILASSLAASAYVMNYNANYLSGTSIIVTRSETLYFNITDNRYMPHIYAVKYVGELRSSVPCQIVLEDKFSANLQDFYSLTNNGFYNSTRGNLDIYVDNRSNTSQQNQQYNRNFTATAIFTVNNWSSPQRNIHPIPENETPIWVLKPSTFKAGDSKDTEITISNLKLQNTTGMKLVDIRIFPLTPASWTVTFLDASPSNSSSWYGLNLGIEWNMLPHEVKPNGNFSVRYHISVPSSYSGNPNTLFDSKIDIQYPSHNFDPYIEGTPTVNCPTLTFYDQGITYEYPSRWIP